VNSIRIASSSVLATSAMTLYSYTLSNKHHVQYREPEILHILLQRLLRTGQKSYSTADGWLIHYAVGTMFSMLYHTLWKKTSFKPTILNGIILGSMSGLIGISVWQKVFEWHSDPPIINKNKFLIHLLPAHLIFGIISVIGYQLPVIKIPNHS
jgi:hypothetical protein